MKLKRLVLSGFKSFADRTEFDFDEGITCVVGPNGCGKSNLVDAFKWVLGSQSAKSLRGTEMADVIFNGSTSRRACGMAEVSLLFDNSRGVLQPGGKGSKEPAGDILSVTRRLYRSGLSEYLINKTPCRLKDIREMFMDTGIGVDAYSLIEQGKVEVFLQASQDERRAIFDEAAGISKYKARKKEALRKLERVEQNLLRLNDIVQEVERRLRSIKVQAGRARSYQTHSQRLKELRSLHFLAGYHGLTRNRTDLQGELDSANDALSAITARIDQLEAARSASEIEAVDLERAARDLQGKIASLGARITTCEERAEMLGARVKELDEQILGALARSESLEAKVEEGQAQAAGRKEQLRQLEHSSAALAEEHKGAREQHAAGELALTQLAGRLEDEKAGTIDLFRRTAQLHNEIHGLGIRRESLHGQKQRLANRAEEIESLLRALLVDKAEHEAKLRDVMSVIEESTARLHDAREASQRLHDGEQELRRELSDARERRSALTSRIEALQEMQDRLEGVAAGVRTVVEAQRDGRLTALRGMLGDFLQADVAHATLVEAALAGADQQVFVNRFDELAAEAEVLRGVLGENATVEVVCLDRLAPGGNEIPADACPQAIARVIDFVQYDDDLAPLVRRLLGGTLLVATLSDAAAAREQVPAARFVTRSGEVLEPDGRVRFGAARRAAGVIARRSELAELQASRIDLDGRIVEIEGRCASTRSELDHLDELQQHLRTAIYEANTERVECQSRTGQLDEQVDTLRREQPVVSGDVEGLAAEIDSTVRAEHDARQKASELEDLNRRRQEEIERLGEQIDEARHRQGAAAEKLTEMKVALGAADERKRAARDALEAVGRQVEGMLRDLAADRQQIDLDRRRKADAEAGIAQARQETDRLFDEQQQLNRDSGDIEESRKGLTEKLAEIRTQLGEKRKAHTEGAEQVQAKRVELGEVDVRIENLITRAGEEMGMDLLALSQTYEHDEKRDWDAVEAEIQELRGKIERLGNVNLDAIAEQEELDRRREFLRGQLTDVEDSRHQLASLIQRINRESRDMFLEMFHKVREHFQALFRKLFGGGRADIVMIDPENVLETGIEIIARPPGKELQSLSLLSGGEKTMTALSLMFSIFKCRPSPFCLLDEVDAALDEQNTERFVHLVGEFVDNSQFLIISHAKRTMSMADVLYGVTMQEPGVSKRISVRFEDAGAEVGEPLEPAAAV